MIKYKTIFQKSNTPIGPPRCLRVKVQRTNSVTYLLEDYRGKSVAGTFYEYELYRAIHSDI